MSVVLVCLLLLTLQTRGGGTGRAADVVSGLATPAQAVLAKAHRGALSLWAGYREWKSAWSENLVLRAENERLRVQSLQVGEAQAENSRLRRLLALRERLPLSTLAGEVIGRESGGWVRALTVNRGVGDGITTQTPVIVPDGLVGRVVRVRLGASVVQLLTDPASVVGAVVQRTRTSGLVEGEPGGTLRFKFMAREGAGILPGDLIVTSGQGHVFPKGLPVGRVVAIEDKGSALFHFAVLAPAADFARVEEVLLLTGQTPRDLAALFQKDG
ncbi:MAG: rod shape-determining protein MreC [Candidatus Rokubacteria bacterium GWC2_70_16]|nr:MAG: rod shape-determining protein MreC [Candidatus Rokubacteria bacterium GWC2_70_16]